MTDLNEIFYAGLRAACGPARITSLVVLAREGPSTTSQICALTGRAKQNVWEALRDLKADGLVHIINYTPPVKGKRGGNRRQIIWAIGDAPSLPLGKLPKRSRRAEKTVISNLAKARECGPDWTGGLLRKNIPSTIK